MSSDFDMAAFVRERNEMLLEAPANLQLMRDFYYKHNGRHMTGDDEMLLVAIHKARTAARGLPRGERLRSKDWLEERNMRSLDDGDLK